MTTKESLLYSVADAIQIPLVPFVGGYLGKAKQLVKVGPWSLPYEPAAISDHLSADYATFLVHINRDLFLYVEASEVGSKSLLFTHVVNGALVGLNAGNMKNFITGKLGDTMKKLEKGIAASYKFSSDTMAWEPLNVTVA